MWEWKLKYINKWYQTNVVSRGSWKIVVCSNSTMGQRYKASIAAIWQHFVLNSYHKTIAVSLNSATLFWQHCAKQSNWQDQIPRLEGSSNIGRNVVCKDLKIYGTQWFFRGIFV